MLRELHISNLAVIADARIEFAQLTEKDERRQGRGRGGAHRLVRICSDQFTQAGGDAAIHALCQSTHSSDASGRVGIIQAQACEGP